MTELHASADEGHERLKTNKTFRVDLSTYGDPSRMTVLIVPFTGNLPLSIDPNTGDILDAEEVVERVKTGNNMLGFYSPLAQVGDTLLMTINEIHTRCVLA